MKRNKFVSQQELNALNHIATAVCVCAHVLLLRDVAFFSSLAFDVIIYAELLVNAYAHVHARFMK